MSKILIRDLNTNEEHLLDGDTPCLAVSYDDDENASTVRSLGYERETGLTFQDPDQQVCVGLDAFRKGNTPYVWDEETHTYCASLVISIFPTTGRSAPTDRAWVEDRDDVLTFARVLDDLGAFADHDAIFAYFEKPWKWSAERARWVAAGAPCTALNEHQQSYVLTGEVG